MLRVNTTRTGALARLDAFGVLGEPYTERVWVMENTGYNDYDALNLSLEKRYSNNWSGRISYSLSKSRGTAENQADRNTLPDADRPQPRRVWRARPASIAATSSRSTAASRFPNRRRDGIRDAALHERVAILDFQQQRRRRSQRRAERSVAGRRLQRHAARRRGDDRRRESRRTQRRNRPRLLPARLCAPAGAGGSRALTRPSCSSTSSTSPTAPISITRRATSGLTSTFLVLTNLRGGGGFPRQAQFGVRYSF